VREHHLSVSGWWPVAVGVFVLALAVREIFRDLFQPSGSGALSSYMGRWIFQLSRKLKFLMEVAGPLAVVLVIGCWTFLLAASFALIYSASYPDGFSIEGEARHGFSEFTTLLAFSLASLTTLGTPDLTPKPDWLRLIVGVESLVGFSLVTASISWIVLIYPALGRMRSLARRAAILIKAQEQTGIRAISQQSESLLAQLTEGVIRTRVDLIHYPLIYYFHADSERASLALALLTIEKLAREAGQLEGADHVQLHAAMLKAALADLAKVLAHRFVRAHEDDPRAVFAAFAKDHLARQEAVDKYSD
jgi:hypothetical protein